MELKSAAVRGQPPTHALKGLSDVPFFPAHALHALCNVLHVMCVCYMPSSSLEQWGRRSCAAPKKLLARTRCLTPCSFLQQ